jgi:hypothetical protein
LPGQNDADGGIFDDWGVPEVLSQQVFEAIERLVQGG